MQWILYGKLYWTYTCIFVCSNTSFSINRRQIYGNKFRCIEYYLLLHVKLLIKSKDRIEKLQPQKKKMISMDHFKKAYDMLIMMYLSVH